MDMNNENVVVSNAVENLRLAAEGIETAAGEITSQYNAAAAELAAAVAKYNAGIHDRENQIINTAAEYKSRIDRIEEQMSAIKPSMISATIANDQKKRDELETRMKKLNDEKEVVATQMQWFLEAPVLEESELYDALRRSYEKYIACMDFCREKAGELRSCILEVGQLMDNVPELKISPYGSSAYGRISSARMRSETIAQMIKRRETEDAAEMERQIALERQRARLAEEAKEELAAKAKEQEEKKIFERALEAGKVKNACTGTL